MYITTLMSVYSFTSVFGYWLWHIMSYDKYIRLIYCWCKVMMIIAHIIIIIFEFKVYCVHCFAALNHHLFSFRKNSPADKTKAET